MGVLLFDDITIVTKDRILVGLEYGLPKCIFAYGRYAFAVGCHHVDRSLGVGERWLVDIQHE